MVRGSAPDGKWPLTFCSTSVNVEMQSLWQFYPDLRSVVSGNVPKVERIVRLYRDSTNGLKDDADHAWIRSACLPETADTSGFATISPNTSPNRGSSSTSTTLRQYMGRIEAHWLTRQTPYSRRLCWRKPLEPGPTIRWPTLNIPIIPVPGESRIRESCVRNQVAHWNAPPEREREGGRGWEQELLVVVVVVVKVKKNLNSLQTTLIQNGTSPSYLPEKGRHRFNMSQGKS